MKQLEDNGMQFVGHDDEGKRMEIMELQGTLFTAFIWPAWQFLTGYTWTDFHDFFTKLWIFD